MKKVDKTNLKIFVESSFVIISAAIGFGGGVLANSISNGTIPFTFSTTLLASTFGTFALVQSGLISEIIARNKNRKSKVNDNLKDNVNEKKEQSQEKEKNYESSKKQISQKEIHEIHARGHITAEEKVQEWEDMGLCAPGDAIESAEHRCEKFGNCHDCLVDYASVKDEYEPFELKMSDTLFKDFNVQYLLKKENNDDLESEQIDEISKEERGPVKKLVPNKRKK